MMSSSSGSAKSSTVSIPEYFWHMKLNVFHRSIDTWSWNWINVEQIFLTQIMLIHDWFVRKLMYRTPPTLFFQLLMIIIHDLEIVISLFGDSQNNHWSRSGTTSECAPLSFVMPVASFNSYILIGPPWASYIMIGQNDVEKSSSALHHAHVKPSILIDHNVAQKPNSSMLDQLPMWKTPPSGSRFKCS